MHKRFVISILVPDRAGIMRDLTSAVTDLGANINSVSQTVVEGYFSVALTVTFADAQTATAVQAAIARNFRSGEAGILVCPFAPVRRSPKLRGGQGYVLCITGRDQPGILKRATTFLAAHAINIESWECGLEDATVTYLAELTVPPRLEIRQVQHELQELLSPMGLRTSLQHANIFRATNEIGPIRSLLRETDRD